MSFSSLSPSTNHASRNGHTGTYDNVAAPKSESDLPKFLESLDTRISSGRLTFNIRNTMPRLLRMKLSLCS